MNEILKGSKSSGCFQRLNFPDQVPPDEPEESISPKFSIQQLEEIFQEELADLRAEAKNKGLKDGLDSAEEIVQAEVQEKLDSFVQSTKEKESLLAKKLQEADEQLEQLKVRLAVIADGVVRQDRELEQSVVNLSLKCVYALMHESYSNEELVSAYIRKKVEAFKTESPLILIVSGEHATFWDKAIQNLENISIQYDKNMSSAEMRFLYGSSEACCSISADLDKLKNCLLDVFEARHPNRV